jgi:hypothetical protein
VTTYGLKSYVWTDRVVVEVPDRNSAQEVITKQLTGLDLTYFTPKAGETFPIFSDDNFDPVLLWITEDIDHNLMFFVAKQQQ